MSEESCRAMKEPTFIDRADVIRTSLGECHAILDGLLGTEKDICDAEKEPDCTTARLYQILGNDVGLAEKLVKRLTILSKKF